MGSLHGLTTLGLNHHVRQGETREVLAHVVTNIGPHTE
jgi:hypothetical protein